MIQNIRAKKWYIASSLGLAGAVAFLGWAVSEFMLRSLVMHEVASARQVHADMLRGSQVLTAIALFGVSLYFKTKLIWPTSMIVIAFLISELSLGVVVVGPSRLRALLSIDPYYGYSDRMWRFLLFVVTFLMGTTLFEVFWGAKDGGVNSVPLELSRESQSNIDE